MIPVNEMEVNALNLTRTPPRGGGVTTREERVAESGRARRRNAQTVRVERIENGYLLTEVATGETCYYANISQHDGIHVQDKRNCTHVLGHLLWFFAQEAQRDQAPEDEE